MSVPPTASRMGEHKLICHFDDQSLELYDVVGDIREETDLTGEKPELAEKMNARLQQWLFDTKAGIPPKRSKE